MKTLLLTTLSALALAGAAQAAPNLVTNGGFETVTGGPGRSHEFGASYKYGQTVAGWTSADASAFNLIFYGANETVDADTRFSPANGGEPGQYLWSSPASPTGGKFVALDGDTGQTNPIGAVDGTYNGRLEQTINGLTVGAKYSVQFDFARAQYKDRTGDTSDNLFVTFGTDTQSTGSASNPSQGFTGWFHQNYTFTATSVSQVLSFLAVGTPTGLPPVVLLDGVSVTENTVPEPAMLGLMGLGLAGFAAARLRRR